MLFDSPNGFIFFIKLTAKKQQHICQHSDISHNKKETANQLQSSKRSPWSRSESARRTSATDDSARWWESGDPGSHGPKWLPGNTLGIQPCSWKRTFHQPCHYLSSPLPPLSKWCCNATREANKSASKNNWFLTPWRCGPPRQGWSPASCLSAISAAELVQPDVTLAFPRDNALPFCTAGILSGHERPVARTGRHHHGERLKSSVCRQSSVGWSHN